MESGCRFEGLGELDTVRRGGREEVEEEGQVVEYLDV